jgi:hypothetical protein
MAYSRSRVRLLLRLYRWPLTALAIVVVAAGSLLVWVMMHRTPRKLAFTDWASTDTSGSQAQKRSPLGLSESERKQAEATPVRPPLAIPPPSDLAGERAMPVLPGSADAEQPGAAETAASHSALLSTPWPVEGQRFRAQHKKGFGGCWGELLLGADRLVFTCADDPGKNVTLPVSQITGVDGDGVAAGSDKYHFGIQSLSGKRVVHELFGEWIARVRATHPSP